MRPDSDDYTEAGFASRGVCLMPPESILGFTTTYDTARAIGTLSMMTSTRLHQSPAEARLLSPGWLAVGAFVPLRNGSNFVD